jgi:hypothetical protein
MQIGHKVDGIWNLVIDIPKYYRNIVQKHSTLGALISERIEIHMAAWPHLQHMTKIYTRCGLLIPTVQT